MPLDVPVHTCALGYLWTLLLCKTCFYKLYRRPVASLSSTCRRTFSNSGMFRQPAGDKMAPALCLPPEMLLLMPERCVSTLLLSCKPMLSSTLFRNNHQQNLQLYMLSAWAAIWTVSINVWAILFKQLEADAPLSSHQLSKSAAELTMTAIISS